VIVVHILLWMSIELIWESNIL